MLRYLIEKEFKQFMRNKVLPKIIFGMPFLMMLVFPWAANQEIRNINLSVVDLDKSSYSRELIQKTTGTGYFRLKNVSESHEQAMVAIEKGEADIILEIPDGFERDFTKLGVSRVSVMANSVNATKGNLGGAYLQSIINDYSSQLSEGGASNVNQKAPKLSLSMMYRFNPRLVYYDYMIPALMVMLLTMFCGYFMALNIVGEKEIGTIEQMNVSPVSKLTFILSKLIPYWIIGLFVLTLCFLLAYLVYDLVPVGSYMTIYLASVIYILVVSGFGLVVSNYSDTMQQAMFVMFFFLLVFILLSGLFTPIASMPEWAQAITLINPLRYYIYVMRAIYLKGSDPIDLWEPLVVLLVFATVSVSWAIISYKKNN